MTNIWKYKRLEICAKYARKLCATQENKQCVYQRSDERCFAVGDIGCCSASSASSSTCWLTLDRSIAQS
uniref:Uncharacterized protein n=1 Tax=Syphacia muris TaxID=451379 RepID=A0A0N5B0T9_9BILA